MDVREGANGSRYEEFTRYLKDRGPALLRIARSLAGNKADAEDLLQAALIKTFLAWDGIQSPQARDGYVRRAMVNTQISEWRRRRIRVYATDDVPDQEVEDPSWQADLADLVSRAVDGLPERQRAVVRLRYFDDMTEAEIARTLGVSVGTVKSTVSRAVTRLRHNAELAAERPSPPPQRSNHHRRATTPVEGTS